MPLTPGSTLGAFEIIDLLGKGGMGEVYRARDTKLGREVAIKVLPEAFASDRERLNRFEREARLLASLNHPNVATVHGFEAAGDVRFLMMELVEGDTLEDRIARGPLSVKEALPLFVQIAEGLDAAHDQGIIHRDLKPANIKVTPDGRAKILDFGLAASVGAGFKSAHPDDKTTPGTPPVSTLTTDGQILGTPSYMSPEQARGKKVDKRTDIWAFGCCLYEALTGDIPFKGDTIADTVGAIMEREPDWSSLPGDTPEHVQSLLEKCLEKDPRKRLRDIGDAWIAFEENAASDAGDSIALAANRASTGLKIVAGVLAVVTLTLAGILVKNRGVDSPAEQQSNPIFDNSSFRYSVPTVSQESNASIGNLVVTPDGRHIVFKENTNLVGALYVHDVGTLDSRMLKDTAGAGPHFLSPDGIWVAFPQDGKLMKTRVDGKGSPQVVEDTLSIATYAHWNSDSYIYYTPSWSSPLFRIPADGGEPESVTSLNEAEEEIAHWFPRYLPGGNKILFTVATLNATYRDYWVAVVDVHTHEITKLFNGGKAEYASSGHLVFFATTRITQCPSTPTP